MMFHKDVLFLPISTSSLTSSCTSSSSSVFDRFKVNWKLTIDRFAGYDKSVLQ